MLILDKTGCNTDLLFSSWNAYYNGPIFRARLCRPYYKIEGGNVIRSSEVFVSVSFSKIISNAKDKSIFSYIRPMEKTITVSNETEEATYTKAKTQVFYF